MVWCVLGQEERCPCLSYLVAGWQLEQRELLEQRLQGQDRDGVTGAVSSFSRAQSIIQGHVYACFLQAEERSLVKVMW